MENVLERYPHHLSGGQRQRLAIAAALILEPVFVVADEPVSMLDVSVRAEILKLMLDLQKNKNLTYMFITHDLSLAWMVADRIAVFYLGKMVEIGSLRISSITANIPIQRRLSLLFRRWEIKRASDMCCREKHLRRC